MKKELLHLYHLQNQKKKKLLSLKNKLFAKIYEDILAKKPLHSIKNDLLSLTINTKVVDSVVDKKLLYMAVKIATKTKKIDNNQPSGVLSVAIVEAFLHNKYNASMKKVINSGLTEETNIGKDMLLGDFFDKNRDSGKIFYLASSHDDCAEDHKPYQGKLYIDANWESIISSELKKKVSKYLASHSIKTFQWVIGKPAWFVTRPYCRHYFVSIPTNQIFKFGVNKLKEKYKTHTDEGDTDFQTPAKAALEEYEDRLRMLKGLYRVRPNEKLKREIEKTELLIRKWKKLL